ncbi:methyltransferase [Winogradskya consettensis]|uniref:Hydroxyneurosporene-O-methyltransferase n=1 Tax=Winogradskya consettensis TaxID=113560 RepID=A0A919S9N5_9ACTN|nr:methyltransferase [Actinoplanes consettensis]GIM68438.1 hydroxyneurosporene-O-methyltransferase [Actinoplanes consettensis]
MTAPAIVLSPATLAAVSPTPQQELLNLLAGKMVSAVVCVLARVGVADLLAEGPREVADLAAATDTDPGMLYRFLRCAAGAGVFAEQADGRFGLTPTADLLRSDAPGSVRHLAYLYGEESVWNCFGTAIDTLRTGQPTGPALRGGQGWFDYMETAHGGEYAEVFHKAMTGVSNRADQVAKDFDFSRFQHVADIGGGQGRLLAAILTEQPGIRGTLFDTASAVAGAAPVLAEQGVADRVECVVGDFFEAVPSGPDAYVMKAILHDWSDEDSVRILKSIRTAIGDNTQARVLLVESVVADLNEWHFAKAMDIAMGVSLGGKERNRAQWAELLSQAGFELVDVTRTHPPHSVVEARPL